MKKLLCLAVVALVSLATLCAVEPEKLKMMEDFIDHGSYVKKIYQDGQVEYRCGNPKDTGVWVTISDKKFEYNYVTGVDLTWDRWEMSADEHGNLIFTEIEDWRSKKAAKGKK